MEPILETITAPLEGLEMGIWQRANNWYQIWRAIWYFEDVFTQLVSFISFKILSLPVVD